MNSSLFLCCAMEFVFIISQYAMLNRESGNVPSFFSSFAHKSLNDSDAQNQNCIANWFSHSAFSS